MTKASSFLILTRGRAQNQRTGAFAIANVPLDKPAGALDVGSSN
jgi:hypothetical protein